MNYKWTKYLIPLAAIAVFAFAGCGKSDAPEQAQSTTEAVAEEKPEVAVAEPAPVQQQQQTQAQTKPAAPAQKPAAEKPKPKPEPVKEKVIPASVEKEFTIPTGAILTINLTSRLATDESQVGDRFTATLAEPVVVEGVTVVPAGAPVSGRVTHVEEPHRTKGKAQMTLLVDRVEDAAGKTYNVQTAPLAMEAEGDKISDEEKIAAGAVVGGIIGAIAKKKPKGAAVGAAAGAAAGGAVALATKGKQLVFEPGQSFAFEVTGSDRIPVVVQQAGSGN